MTTYKLLHTDARSIDLPDKSVNCCITSPPYFGLRDYGIAGQLGQESSPQEYVDALVDVFREVKRVLTDDGTLWLNLGDSYVSSRAKQVSQTKDTSRADRAGYVFNTRPSGGKLKPKNLIGIPWRVAFALQEDGWFLRSDIIWEKTNAMPESVKDRPTNSHEHIFLLSKRAKYYYDNNSIREPISEATKARNKYSRDRSQRGGGSVESLAGYHGNPDLGDMKCSNTRNKRTVWTVPTANYQGAHFAVFPEKLILPMVLAGCPEDGTVLDPFVGSGTTMVVAMKNGRNAVGCDLNQEYLNIAKIRIEENS